MRVETNEGDIDVLETGVSDNAADITALTMRVAANEEKLDLLMFDVGDLEIELTKLADSALIENYFEVNDVTLSFPQGTSDTSLVGPFCVSERGTFIFQLSVNYNFVAAGGAFSSLRT